MKPIRNTIAFPFYVLAFVLHLLCAFFTVAAQKIAGDTVPPSRLEKWAMAAICIIAASSIPAWVASRPAPAIDYIRLAPRPAMDFSAVAVNYPSDRLPEIKSLIRLSACVYAERALRQWLSPERVEFAACGDGGRNITAVDDNLMDVTISGTAIVGTASRPFTVTLQHNPISTDDEGFITRDIQIEQASTQVACAVAQ